MILRVGPGVTYRSRFAGDTARIAVVYRLLRVHGMSRLEARNIILATMMIGKFAERIDASATTRDAVPA